MPGYTLTKNKQTLFDGLGFTPIHFLCVSGAVQSVVAQHRVGAIASVRARGCRPVAMEPAKGGANVTQGIV